MSTDPWLLLHGTPLTPEVWDGVSVALGPGAVTVSPDLDALILSRVPSGDQDELARQIAATVPPGRYHVVGHSFGGQVGLDLALNAPHLVGRLTLMCTRDTPFPAFSTTAAGLRAGAATDAGATLARWFTPDELAADGPVVRYGRRCVETADRTAWAAALDAIAGYDRTDRVAALDLPVTVIAAERDPVSTPAAMAAMAARIPGAAFRLLPGAAHMSPFVDPAALAAELLAAP